MDPPASGVAVLVVVAIGAAAIIMINNNNNVSDCPSFLFFLKDKRNESDR